MESKDNEVKRPQVVEARVRNINHNVRCTECGSQSIEDSQADIAILLRKLKWYSLGRNQVWGYRGHTYPDNYFMLHIYVAPTPLCV